MKLSFIHFHDQKYIGIIYQNSINKHKIKTGMLILDANW